MLGSSSLMASRLVVGDQTVRALCEVALLLVRSAVPLWAVLTPTIQCYIRSPEPADSTIAVPRAYPLRP